MSEEQEQKVIQKQAEVTHIEECKTKNDKAYRKFRVIESGENIEKTMSWFEYEAAKAISIGDKVEVFYTEKDSKGKYGKITYRNVNSMATTGKSETIKQETPSLQMKPDELHERKMNEILFGQAMNIASNFAIAYKESGVEGKIDHWFDKTYEYIKLKRKEKLGR